METVNTPWKNKQKLQSFTHKWIMPQTFIFEVGKLVIRMHFPHNNHYTKTVMHGNYFINSNFIHNVLFSYMKKIIEHSYMLGITLGILHLSYLMLKQPHGIVSMLLSWSRSH